MPDIAHRLYPVRICDCYFRLSPSGFLLLEFPLAVRSWADGVQNTYCVNAFNFKLLSHTVSAFIRYCYFFFFGLECRGGRCHFTGEASEMVMTVPTLIEKYFLFIESLISIHLNNYIRCTLCVYYIEFTEYVLSE